MSFITFSSLKEILDVLGKASNEDAYDYLKSTGTKYIEASQGGQSIIKLVNNLIVEPSFIVSQTLKNDAETTEILKLLTNLFTGYYAQAFHMLANVQQVEPNKAMSLLGTASVESDNALYRGLNLDTVSLEDIGKEDFISLPLNISLEAGKNKASKASVSGQEFDSKVNLVLGRTFTITVKKGDNDVSFPMTVRAGVKYANFSVITQLINLQGKTKNLFTRLDEWRSGGITFFKDFLFASDLIKEYKHARMKSDKDDVLEQVANRSRNTVKNYVKNNTVNFGGLYSGLVLSSDEVIKLESDIGGKLSKFRVRQKVMESSHSIFLVVVDRKWERVIFYTRDLSSFSDVSFKDLKSGKGSDVDVMEIFKSFNSGMVPSL